MLRWLRGKGKFIEFVKYIRCRHARTHASTHTDSSRLACGSLSYVILLFCAAAAVVVIFISNRPIEYNISHLYFHQEALFARYWLEYALISDKLNVINTFYILVTNCLASAFPFIAAQHRILFFLGSHIDVPMFLLTKHTSGQLKIVCSSHCSAK